MVQKLVVRFRNRVTGELLEFGCDLKDKEGRAFRKSDFRYRNHEVV